MNELQLYIDIYGFDQIEIQFETELQKKFVVDYFKKYFIIQDIKTINCLNQHRKKIIIKSVKEYRKDTYQIEQMLDYICVSVWDSPENNISCMRGIRDYIFYYIKTYHGFHYLHAAAVEKNGNVILILGDKFTGKTSLMLNFLKNKWNFMSNDKVGIKYDGKDILVLGFPIAAGIRKDVAEKFLNIEIENCEDDKKYLTPNEMSNYFNINISPVGKLKLIITPKYVETNIGCITPMEHEYYSDLIYTSEIPSLYLADSFLSLTKENNFTETAEYVIKNMKQYVVEYNQCIADATIDQIYKKVN